LLQTEPNKVSQRPVGDGGRLFRSLSTIHIDTKRTRADDGGWYAPANEPPTTTRTLAPPPIPESRWLQHQQPAALSVLSPVDTVPLPPSLAARKQQPPQAIDISSLSLELQQTFANVFRDANVVSPADRELVSNFLVGRQCKSAHAHACSMDALVAYPVALWLAL
jgi:hypothetical protein